MTEAPHAVFWDMDGTIVDTEPFWMAAETRMVESFGGEWTHESALQLVGKGSRTPPKSSAMPGFDSRWTRSCSR
ncbi:HAD hydrolase-like protein [Microbacterium sp. NIBRBAC000506063]|uniref:HAD hydrolase-like protein n=1 Tax=Microbacterium sp. NIBRBAC000506063 TaxID=2734618 RepID=UPI001CB6E063|nr:HAD hydrolase-like protein [Microbacterium sp. NIBRBAC000506063]